MKNKVFDFEIATPSEQCMKKKIGPELNLYILISCLFCQISVLKRKKKFEIAFDRLMLFERNIC